MRPASIERKLLYLHCLWQRTFSNKSKTSALKLVSQHEIGVTVTELKELIKMSGAVKNEDSSNLSAIFSSNEIFHTSFLLTKWNPKIWVDLGKSHSFLRVLGLFTVFFINSTQSFCMLLSLLLLVPETLLEASKTLFSPVLQCCIEHQPQWGSSERLNWHDLTSQLNPWRCSW